MSCYGRPLFSCRILLSNVAKVTIEDLKRVGEVYFTRLFDPAHTTTAVCCNPSKVTEVKEGLEKYVCVCYIYVCTLCMYVLIHVQNCI